MKPAAQLSLLDVPPAPASAVSPKAKARAICACGHELAHHDGKGCRYGRDTKFGGCPCKKHHGKNEKPTLEKPFGALTLMRPDTKRPKVMGWATVTSSRVEIFLDGLKTRRPNETMRFFGGASARPGLARMMMAGIANANKAQNERAMSAVEQCRLAGRPRPSKVTLTRLSTGRIDDDGLTGALKYIRDGVAEGLYFDDFEFSIAGQVAGKVPLFYLQRAAGKRGVHGVEIVLEWSAT